MSVKDRDFEEYIKYSNISYPEEMISEEKNKIKNTLHYAMWDYSRAKKDFMEAVCEAWEQLVNDIKKAFHIRK